MLILCIALGTLIGVMASSLLSILLLTNKYFMSWFTNKYVKLFTDIASDIEFGNMEKED